MSRTLVGNIDLLEQDLGRVGRSKLLASLGGDIKDSNIAALLKKLVGKRTAQTACAARNHSSTTRNLHGNAKLRVQKGEKKGESRKRS